MLKRLCCGGRGGRNRGRKIKCDENKIVQMVAKVRNYDLVNPEDLQVFWEHAEEAI